MKKVLVIDNYDSFTYNLVHILRKLGHSEDMKIVRNDQFQLEEVEEYESVLLSPGSGLPKDAGLMPEVVKTFSSSKNILGVCLGHQGIGEAFGGKLFNLPQVYHGMVTPIEIIVEDKIFSGIPQTFNACRYHSWVVEKDSIGDELEVTSVAENGNVMSIQHKKYNVRGVQFHPESIMTEHGEKLIENWLQL